MDELNQHECMATMTALIKHMWREQILPKEGEVSFSANRSLSHLILFVAIILRKNIS